MQHESVRIEFLTILTPENVAKCTNFGTDIPFGRRGAGRTWHHRRALPVPTSNIMQEKVQKMGRLLQK